MDATQRTFLPGFTEEGSDKLLMHFLWMQQLFRHTFETLRYTPLDYALMGEHHSVAQYMIEQGALSITGIQDIAAGRIQVSGICMRTKAQ